MAWEDRKPIKSRLVRPNWVGQSQPVHLPERSRQRRGNLLNERIGYDQR